MNENQNSGETDIVQVNVYTIGFQPATISLFVQPLRAGSSRYRFTEVNLQLTVKQFKEEASARVIDLQQQAVSLCLGDKELPEQDCLRGICGLDDESVLLCRVANKGGEDYL